MPEVLFTIPSQLSMSGLLALVEGVGAYAWVYEWGMFFFLLVAAGEAAWVFIDSSEKRKADKALTPRILALVGVFLIVPAFIFRFTGNLAGGQFAIQLNGGGVAEYYTDAIPYNVKWLLAGYGPKIALLAFIGVGLSTLAAILYAATVSRQRPSTEFISALNSQFGDLRQEIQSVKNRPGAAVPQTVAAGAGAYAGTQQADPRRAAATVMERPTSSAATIIDRPGAGAAELRVVSGPSTGRSWRLPAGEAKIGRDPGNLVAIDDAKSSREHAKVRYADGMYTVADLGSSNGTFVNERPVAGQIPLSDGDLIRVGDTVFAFKSAGA